MSRETKRTAQLEAVAIIRAVLADDTATAGQLLAGSDEPRELAHAACSLAAALVATLVPAGDRRRVLDGLTAGAVGEG